MANFSRQCRLVKDNAEKVSWIPEKFAVVGKILKLKEDNGWEVVSVGSRMESSVVNEKSQEYKKHRGTTDI